MGNVKINKSIVKNIKNIDEFEVDFNGATAYIIGGNTKGKTTFIRFLIDRLLSNTNDSKVLKDKTKEGYSEIQMSDGASFRYIITPEGKEKLSYISNGIEVKATKEIINRYISKPFDIDRFINSTPKDKVELLTRALNIDITQEKQDLVEAINNRRTWLNIKNEREAVLKNSTFVEGDVIDIDALLAKRKSIIDKYEKEVEEVNKKNEQIKADYDNKYKVLLSKMLEFNRQQNELKQKRDDIKQSIDILKKYSLDNIIKQLEEYLKSLPQPQPEKTIEQLDSYIGKPNYIAIPNKPDLTDIETKIEEARKHNALLENNKIYTANKANYEDALAEYNAADEQVKRIELAIKKKLASAKLPKGLTITEENIFYNGYEVDDKHLSTSELYIVALKLASITLKELKTLYFDCSPLDKNSIKDVLQWAQENDYQLLIERPDFDGGELRFELIEE